MTWGGRSEKVGQLGYIMGETLGVVGAPFEMVGFTTHYSDYGFGHSSNNHPQKPIPKGMHYTRTTPLHLVVYKTFDEKRVRDMDKRMVCVSKFSQCALTIEGEPLLWLASRLASRPEQRKILIVMCDGAPQADGYEESDAVRRHVPLAAKKVRNVGIELISVGIQTDAPRAFYGEESFVQYDNLDMLLTHFYPKLGKILRGESKSSLT
jgi:cobaltochelatase CobT